MCFAVTDGKNYVYSRNDYKGLEKADTKSNTGEIRSCKLLPFLMQRQKKIVSKNCRTNHQGIKTGWTWTKASFFSAWWSINGEPYVIEYNCRLGDPETEVVVPRLKNDLADIFIAIAENKVDQLKIEIDDRVAAAVVVVSGGYPGPYVKGKVIAGLATQPLEGSMVFHAGTINNGDEIITNGGRVLAVNIICGIILQKPVESVYSRTNCIWWYVLQAGYWIWIS